MTSNELTNILKEVDLNQSDKDLKKNLRKQKVSQKGITRLAKTMDKKVPIKATISQRFRRLIDFRNTLMEHEDTVVRKLNFDETKENTKTKRKKKKKTRRSKKKPMTKKVPEEKEETKQKP